MIVYNDIMKRLLSCGWTAYKLHKENALSNSVIDRLRSGQPITTTTIDTLCKLCHCQPGDLLRYVPDQAEQE